MLQWATGAVGREALRGIIDHPDLELAGVKVYAADKDGVDAGLLVKRAPMGVVARIDVESLLGTTDCVLYTPRTRRSMRSAGFWPPAPTS